MRYANGKYVTDAGVAMNKFTQVLANTEKQANIPFLKEKLSDPESSRLIASIAIQAGEEYDGFNDAEFAVEILSETVRSLMEAISKATDRMENGPVVWDLLRASIVSTTVYGIALRTALNKVKVPRNKTKQ